MHEGPNGTNGQSEKEYLMRFLIAVLAMAAVVPMASAQTPLSTTQPATRPVDAKDKTSLAWEYVPGQKYTLTQRMTISTRWVLSEDVSLSVQDVDAIELEVEAFAQDSSGTRIEATIRGALRQNGEEGKPLAEQNTETSKLMKGLVVKVQQDAKGKLTVLQGMEQYVKKLTVPMTDGERQTLTNQLNRAIATIIASPRDALADKPVAVGETWEFRSSRNFMIEPSMDVDLGLKCKLKDVRQDKAGRVAVIEISGSGQAAGEGDEGKFGLTGQIVIGLEKGAILQQTIQATGQGAAQSFTAKIETVLKQAPAASQPATQAK